MNFNDKKWEDPVLMMQVCRSRKFVMADSQAFFKLVVKNRLAYNFVNVAKMFLDSTEKLSN